MQVYTETNKISIEAYNKTQKQNKFKQKHTNKKSIEIYKQNKYRNIQTS